MSVSTNKCTWIVGCSSNSKWQLLSCATIAFSERCVDFFPVHVMKACRGIKGITPLILILGTGWIWVVNVTHRPLYPRSRTLVPLWVGGWVDPREGPTCNMAAVPTARNLWYLLILSRDVEHVVWVGYHSYKYVDEMKLRDYVWLINLTKSTWTHKW